MEEQILKSLDSIEEKINKLQEEREALKVSEKTALDELKRLGEEQVKFAQKLADMEQKATVNTNENNEVIKSLGDEIAEKGINTFKQNGHALFVVKDAITSAPGNSFTQTTFKDPYTRPGMIQAVEMPLTISSIFPHVIITTDVVKYLREGSFTNNAATRKEGQEFAASTATAPTIDSAQVENVGHYIRVTEELLANATAFAAYINLKMTYGLELKIEDKLLNGEGTGGGIKGILQSGNFQNKADDAKALLTEEHSTDANLFDFVAALQTVFTKNNHFTPTHLIVTPNDWLRLKLLKDKNGNYVLGGPQSIANRNLWGMQVIECPNPGLTGKYILTQPTLAATVWDRQDMQVNMSYQDGNNFLAKLVTIRVDKTLGLSIERPGAIYSGDFKVPSFE